MSVNSVEIMFCLNCTGTAPTARQSSGWLWCKTRWLWVCSCVADSQPSWLQTSHEQTQEKHQRHFLWWRFTGSSGTVIIFWATRN